MIFLEILEVALESLRANPMRSILTMLGIIIGVAAVVVMVALGTGAGGVIGIGVAMLTSDILAARFGWDAGVARGRGRVVRFRGGHRDRLRLLPAVRASRLDPIDALRYE